MKKKKPNGNKKLNLLKLLYNKYKYKTIMTVKNI